MKPLEQSPRYTENTLTPVTLSGVVAPSKETFETSQAFDFNLVTYSGLEYHLITDSDWREVLFKYRWEEVNVIGLLNASNMSLIPQKVYPKGSAGEKEKAIGFFALQNNEFVQKLVKNVSDLATFPGITLPKLSSFSKVKMRQESQCYLV